MKNYKYIIANPKGFMLIKCNDIEQAKEFITWHCKRCNSAWQLLTHQELKEEDYQIIDLNTIYTYNEWKKEIKLLTPTE